MRKRQHFKTLDGIRLNREDFAYAPSDDPEQWKLPIDARHARAALDMFPRTGLPEAAKREAAKRILQAAVEQRVDAEVVARFKKEHLSGRGIPVLLSGLGAPVATPENALLHRAGAQLRELTVAVTGSWVKDYAFSITAADLFRMASNFRKRKNDMVVIDYEHASENPEVALGGPVPAAGWIHCLCVEPGRPQSLVALVEWTPEAEQMIHNGEYRFFSPAIDWAAMDKDTGKAQGATLTSGALTNHPFLEELPPIMLSGGRILASAESPAPFNRRTTAQEGVNHMKKLMLRPAPDGDEQAGNHAVYEEDGREPLGFISHAELAQYAARHLGVNPDDREDKEPEGNDAQESRVQARSESRQALFMREAVRKGRIDSARASELAKSGKITLAEYIQAQEAEKLIDLAIAGGKILPRDRTFFFIDALDRPAEFTEYVRNAPPTVQLESRGLGWGEALPVDEEIHLGVKHLMEEKGLDYAKALKSFLSSNPALGARYRARHLSRVDADGTAN